MENYLADTQHVRRTVKAVEKVKTWQLAVVLLMAVFVTATFLRLNNIGMIERRDAVYAADEAGDAAQLQRRLYDLQRFVSAHMNTDPGRIALERSYQRDNDRLKEEYMARQSDSPYGNVYKHAADVCDPIGQAQGWRWPDVRYTNCIDQELSKYPDASQSQGQFKPLPPEAYYHTFVSPLWSPDFAGWAVVACVVIVVVIIGRLITLGVLKLMLRSKYRAI